MYPQSVGDLVSTLSQRFTTLFHYLTALQNVVVLVFLSFSWGKASRGPGLHLKSRYINDVGQDKVPFSTTILTRSLLWREASKPPSTNTFIFKWRMKNESLVVLHRRSPTKKRNTIILLWWFETPPIEHTYFYFTAKSCLIKVRCTFC